jgi:hypothetical protein
MFIFFFFYIYGEKPFKSYFNRRLRLELLTLDKIISDEPELKSYNLILGKPPEIFSLRLFPYIFNLMFFI